MENGSDGQGQGVAGGHLPSVPTVVSWGWNTPLMTLLVRLALRASEVALFTPTQGVPDSEAVDEGAELLLFLQPAKNSSPSTVAPELSRGLTSWSWRSASCIALRFVPIQIQTEIAAMHSSRGSSRAPPNRVPREMN
jgi:hypothetical protein